MRRAEADFTAYVAARWPGLVAGVAETGVPVAEAREVVADALSRCRRDWLEAQRHGDVEAVTHDAVQRAVERHRGSASAGDRDVPFDPGPPPSPDDLERLAWQRRARANSRVVVVALPLLLVLAATTWWTTRSDDAAPDRLADAHLTRAENPSRSVWYADGRLHLPHAVLDVAGLRDVTRIGDGAVYLDATGRVVALADDGGRRVLGHQDPGAAVHASDESGWVAWIDTERERTVVADVATGRQIATRAGDRRVVAVDGDTIYVRNAADRLRAWAPDTGTTADLEEQDLLDVLGRKKVVQASPGHIEVVQSLFAVDFTFPGTGARLSAGGDYVTTRGPHGEVELYDTRSGLPALDGQSLRGGDARRDLAVLAATGGDRGTTTYVVDTPDGRRLLEDCDARTRSCRVAAELTRSADVPLLAR